jgi:hypothetical protein
MPNYKKCHSKRCDKCKVDACKVNTKKLNACKIKTKEISSPSYWLKELTRIVVCPSRDLVGENVFLPSYDNLPINLARAATVGNITNIYTPEYYDSMNSFISGGLVYTKEDYETVLAGLKNLWENYNDVPYGAFSGGYVFTHPISGKKVGVAGAKNGTLFIDIDKMSQFSGSMTYEEAVLNGIVILFSPSTWNLWHEYSQVDNFVIHIQEELPVSNGIQVFDLSDPYNPIVLTGKNSDLFDGSFIGQPHRIHDWNTPGQIQGAHFLEVERNVGVNRDVMWLCGITNLGQGNTPTQPKNLIARNNKPEPYDLSYPPDCFDETVTSNIPVENVKPKSSAKSVENLNPLVSAKTGDAQRHLYGKVVRAFDTSVLPDLSPITDWTRAYAHDAEPFTRDGRVYLAISAINSISVYIVDVTDLNNLDPVSFVNYISFPTMLQDLYKWIASDHGPTDQPHSVNMSRCGNFMYVFSEQVGAPLYTVDIHDFSQMRFVNKTYFPDYGTIMHEATRELVPEKGIDRLWVACYDKGVAVYDVSDPNRLSPKLLASNGAATRTSPPGDIDTNRHLNGYWTFSVVGKNNLGAGTLMGDHWTRERELAAWDGLEPFIPAETKVNSDSAYVLFQLKELSD